MGETIPRPVALVGLMASGKTTFGARLATVLDVPFVDSDDEIVRRRGRSVAEIFAAEGEAAFRALEAEVLADLLGRPGCRVVATGGGAVLSTASRRALRDHATVIWLRGDPAVLASRAAADGTRPLLGDDPRGALERLAVERAPLYAGAAHHIVEVGLVDKRTVLRDILDAARRGPGVSAPETEETTTA